MSSACSRGSAVPMLRARLACLALVRAHLLDARLMRRTLIALLALGTLLVRLLAWLLARLLAWLLARLLARTAT